MKQLLHYLVLCAAILFGAQKTLAQTSNVTLTEGCIGNTTYDLSWVYGTGANDGVMIFARAVTTPVNPTGNASTYTGANANYTAATDYGTGGRLVYKGTGTNVTITGLTQGTSYVFKAVAYKNNTGTVWATGTIKSQTITLTDVNNVFGAPANTSAAISWANPPLAACYDEVLVLANTANTFPAAPFAGYTANAAYGGTTGTPAVHAVYSGTGTGVTVTALTNGTPYYFKIYTRKGADWSAGVAVTVTPADLTVLKPGDLAVVGINMDNVLCTANTDKINFILFKDFKVGSSIDITDNGYERVSAGKWGNTEGIYRLTYTSTTNPTAAIPAGTLLQLLVNTSSATSAMTSRAGDTWTIANLDGTKAIALANAGDQVHFMQGGVWSAAAPTHAATYTGGSILNGFTTTTWDAAPGGASSGQSTLYSGLDCLNFKPTVSGSKWLVYNGPFTATTKTNWLLRFRDATLWTAPATCAAYNANAAFANYPISISSTVQAVGSWTAAASTNNWFECGNWDDLLVPTATTDVVVNSSNDIIIDATAPNAAKYGGVAVCHNLTESDAVGAGGGIAFAAVTDKLQVKGDLYLGANVGLALDMQYGGTLEVGGNWTRRTFAFTDMSNAAGKVIFNGTGTQTIAVPDGFSEDFAQLLVDKPFGTVVTTADISLNVAQKLQFVSGGILVIPSGYNVHVTNPINTAIAGYSASGVKDKYIAGILQQDIDVSQNFVLPIGDLPHGCQQATINFANVGGGTTLTAEYNSASANSSSTYSFLCDLDSEGIANDKTSYTKESGTWDFDCDGTNGTYSYTLTLDAAGDNPFASGPNNMLHAGVRTVDCAAGTSGLATSTNTTKSGINHFSPFKILSGGSTVLPVELLSFTARAANKTAFLEWATASERNNDRFDVERSNDGVTFTKIGSVKGNGNSSVALKYDFTDVNVVKGINYYRLRQIDFDGKTSLSKIESVYFEGRIAGISINGNPISDALNYTIASDEAVSGTLQISTIDGVLLRNESINLQAGLHTFSINTTTLPAGVYLLRLVETNGTVSNIRFVKS